jgi:hypothetical protein
MKPVGAGQSFIFSCESQGESKIQRIRAKLNSLVKFLYEYLDCGQPRTSFSRIILNP